MANSSRQRLAWLFFVLALMLYPRAVTAGPPVSPDEITVVFEAYQRARQGGFTEQAVLDLYATPKAASAIKTLIDRGQQPDPPPQSIDDPGSQKLDEARMKMHHENAARLSWVRGGVIEMMDAGKKNKARSDKDIMVWGCDGLRPVSGKANQDLYNRAFASTHTTTDGRPVHPAQLDIAMLNGEARFHDWRDARMSVAEFKTRTLDTQTMLEAQGDASVKEIGTHRIIEAKYARASEVTLIYTHGETKPTELTLPDMPGRELRSFKDELGRDIHYEILVGPTPQVSKRYTDWSADRPYRQAMDAALEWGDMHARSNDFVDQQKYANRVFGDGLNGLAEVDTGGKDYIGHLGGLESDAARREFIRNVAGPTLLGEMGDAQFEQYLKVMELTARIELDKIRGQAKDPGAYLKADIDRFARQADRAGEPISADEALNRARTHFERLQKDMFSRILVATAREKIRQDLDPKHNARLIHKHGRENVAKLRWETRRQLARMMDRVNDPDVVNRIINEAPDRVRLELEQMRDFVRARQAMDRVTRGKTNAAGLSVERYDLEKARKVAETKGAGAEVEMERRTASDKTPLEEKNIIIGAFLNRLQAKADELKAKAKSGYYSDEQITDRMMGRLYDSLGYKQRVIVQDMEVTYKRQLRGSDMLRGALTLGNANSAVSLAKVYQQHGWDSPEMSRALAWEAVSRVPYASDLDTIYQGIRSGDMRAPAFMFMAKVIPGIGHVKLVFDVAKGTIELAWNHTMEPLKQDRVNMIYRGYVDKQDAGLINAGLKEKIEATSLPLLNFVPGDTHTEKRLNVYPYFHAKIDKILKDRGLDPLKDNQQKGDYNFEYDAVRKQVLTGYVDDWFNAAGEFHDNTTAGLTQMGTEKEMKARLYAKLDGDFELSYDFQDARDRALEQMRDQMRRQAKAAQQAHDNEATMLGAAELIGERLAQRTIDALADAADLPPLETVEQVEAEAVPRAVTEGGTTTIEVTVLNAADAAPHAVEIDRITFTGSEPDKAGMGRTYFEQQAADYMDIFDPVLDKQAGIDALDFFLRQMKVSMRVEDAVTRQPIGVDETIDVEVPIIWTDAIDTSGGRMVVVVRIDEKEEPKVANKNKGSAAESDADAFYGKAVSWKTEWVAADEANLCPFGPIDALGEDKRYMGMALRVQWADAPLRKHYFFDGKIAGGEPPYEKELRLRVNSQRAFDPTEADYNAAGNAFHIPLPTPGFSAGSFIVNGKLQAFDEPLVDPGPDPSYTPVGELPVSAGFTVGADYPQTAKLTITNKGPTGIAGSIGVDLCQPGARVARISIGGKTIYAMFGGGCSFIVRGVTDARQATIDFMDFGTTKSLVAKPKEKKEADAASTKEARRRAARARARKFLGGWGDKAEPTSATEGGQPPAAKESDGEKTTTADCIARHQEKLTELQEEADKNLLRIAALYGSMAACHIDETGVSNWGAWQGYRMQQIAKVQQAMAAGGNKDWEGHLYTNVADVRGAKDQTKVTEALDMFHRSMQMKIAGVYGSMADRAVEADNLGQAAGWYAQANTLLLSAAKTDDDKTTAANMVANSYRKLADATFRLTGDTDRAYELLKQAHAASPDADDDPPANPWQIDPQFGGPKPDDATANGDDTTPSTP